MTVNAGLEHGTELLRQLDSDVVRAAGTAVLTQPEGGIILGSFHHMEGGARVVSDVVYGGTIPGETPESPTRYGFLAVDQATGKPELAIAATLEQEELPNEVGSEGDRKTHTLA